MKPRSFDPRAWNILAGLCLTSCSGRTIGSDDVATSATETEGTTQVTDAETTAGTDTSITSSETETDGAECRTDDDCTPGYYCLDGVCEYIPVPDGHWNYQCYSDADCEPVEICDYYYCEYLLSPAPCRPLAPVPIQEIPIASLALTFADVQGDGSKELVIATQSELHVFDSSGAETVSPRELDSDTVTAMVAGPFDATPGDDVMILYADELLLHASDGVGSFAAPSVIPTGLPDSVGALAGDFDGAGLADVLIWASSGAVVSLGSGEVIELSTGDFRTATARAVDELPAGFLLDRSGVLDWFETDGDASGSAWPRGDAPITLTSIDHVGDWFDLSSSLIFSQGPAQEWTLIESWWSLDNEDSDFAWGVNGRVDAMAGADFDGGETADVALIVGGTVQINHQVLSDSSCLELYPFAGVAAALAVGDHDGDGDDELAIRFEDGHVSVVDGE